jgi:hypothetical protein
MRQLRAGVVNIVPLTRQSSTESNEGVFVTGCQIILCTGAGGGEETNTVDF